jgi:hypothetical protein
LLRSEHEMAAVAVRQVLRLFARYRHPVARQAAVEFFRTMWGFGEPAPLLTRDEYGRRLKMRSLGMHPHDAVAASRASLMPPERFEAPLIIRVPAVTSREATDEAPANSDRAGQRYHGSAVTADAGSVPAGSGAPEPVVVVRLPPMETSGASSVLLRFRGLQSACLVGIGCRRAGTALSAAQPTSSASLGSLAIFRGMLFLDV